MRNKTITVDLEAWSPTVLGNATSGIHPDGMFMYTAGSQTGKSNVGMYMTLLKNRIHNINPCQEIFLPMWPIKANSKYQFSRAKWHTADLFNKGYRMDEVREWCVEQFGPQDHDPDAWSRWTNNYNSTFRFRDKEDYMLFVLRWGS